MPVHSAPDLYPSKKVFFSDGRDFWNWVQVPLNPEQLPIEVSAKYGELEPIGWSQSLHQYGSTGSPTGSMQLIYTRQTAERASLNERDFELGYAFFMSFCYPRKRGQDPSELLVMVPNTMEALLRVHSCKVTFTRWTVAMQKREYKVDLTYKIVAEQFRSSRVVKKNGVMHAIDEKLIDMSKHGKLGMTVRRSPMKLHGGGSSSKSGK